MRVVITGATGNCGTALVKRLSADPEITAIVGVARRTPRWSPAKTSWVSADIGVDDLAPVFARADAVVHLAWQMQPSHNLRQLLQTNVHGSRRVFEAAGAAGVHSLVYASSVGAYSPAPRDLAVTESWRTDGIKTSRYSKEKAAVERILDRVQDRYPTLRVVRLRPCLIFQREMGTEVRRLFLGPLIPRAAIKPDLLPVLPVPAALRLQAVHSDDIAAAYHLALTRDVHGAFNIATDPVLDPAGIARVFGARHVAVPAALARAAVSAMWHLRLLPMDAGWIDMGLHSPVLDSSRARAELGWEPTIDGVAALRELVAGMQDGASFDTPPLASGPLGLPSGAGASPSR